MNTAETVAHWLEKQLGSTSKISRAKDHETGIALPASLYRFEDEPCEGAFTWCSVGLCEKTYRLPDGRTTRHELLFSAYKAMPEELLYPVFFDLLASMWKRDTGIIAGELLDAQAPLINNSPMHGLWLYMPVYYKETLYEYTGVHPHVVLAWAIPVGRKEMEYIRERGSEAFSKRLEESDPDLLDWNRAEII